MNFDINGLMEIMEKRLGNRVTSIFMAFILLMIVAWLFTGFLNNSVSPLLSALDKMSFEETGLWKTVHLLVVIFLSVCGILLLYATARVRSLPREKLREIQEMFEREKKWIEKNREKLKEIPEMWEYFTKANKEFENMNEQLGNLLEETGKDVDKLIKAKEEFEEEKSKYRNQ